MRGGAFRTSVRQDHPSPLPLSPRGERGSRRQRGFSLTEGLIASTVMIVAVAALTSLWVGAFKRINRAREVTGATQLARAEVERAKVFGMDNLPMGTYNAGTATWTGSFDPTANAWTSGATAYFDLKGARLASKTSAAILETKATIADSKVLPTPSGYSFQLESRRTFTVVVKRVADGAEVLKLGTILAPGGL